MAERTGRTVQFAIQDNTATPRFSPMFE